MIISEPISPSIIGSSLPVTIISWLIFQLSFVKTNSVKFIISSVLSATVKFKNTSVFIAEVKLTLRIEVVPFSDTLSDKLKTIWATSSSSFVRVGFETSSAPIAS